MYMTFIRMDGKKVLVLVFQVLLTHFLANLHSPFRGNFTGLERHNEVLCKDFASACSCCCDLGKFLSSFIGDTTAQIGADQSAVVGLSRSSNVGYCLTDRSCDWKYLSCCQIFSTPSLMLFISSTYTLSVLFTRTAI